MFIPTKRRSLTVVGLAVLAVAIPATAGGDAAQQQQSVAVSSTLDPRCPRGHSTLREFKVYSSRVYRRTVVTQAAHRRMAYMKRCQAGSWGKRWAARFAARYKREREQRQAAAAAEAAIAAVAPYKCSFGRSAIPCHIVRCESGGDWHVVNEIGALGFYQFLGKRIVWPVRTVAHRLAHHRLAASLWADSHGHWAQCL